jgi:hypothetical protein
MKRGDYLREIEAAANELRVRTRDLVEAANPLNQLRSGLVRDWKWWLPGASAAGFVAARLLRRSSFGNAPRREAGAAHAGGATFWIPTLLKLLPALLSQLIPIFLSVRSGRK